jgi:hypothetical protein
MYSLIPSGYPASGGESDPEEIEWRTEVLYVATAATGKDHPMLVGLASLQLLIFTIDAVQAGLLNAQVEDVRIQNNSADCRH